MPAGLPTSITVEVEFTAGVWTNVTTLTRGFTTTYGRDSAFSGVQPTGLVFTLDNTPDIVTGIAPFTPDNPLSPYFPNVTEGKRVRAYVTKGASTWGRFDGSIDSWEPIVDDPSASLVTVTASDRMAEFARLDLASTGAEFIRYTAAVLGSTWDYWPLDDDGLSPTLRNLNPDGARAVIKQSSPVAGSASLAAPDGLFLEGALTLTGSSDANQTGPVVVITPTGTMKDGNTVRTFQLWFRTTSTDTKTIVAAFYTPDAVLMSLQILTNDLKVCDSAGAVLYTLKTNVNDGGWHSVVLLTDTTTPTTTNFYVDEVGVLALAAYDLRNTARIAVGGALSGSDNVFILDGDIAGIALLSSSSSGGFESRMRAQSLYTAQDYFVELMRFWDPTTTAYTITGTDNRAIARANTVGMTLADALQALAVTAGGVIWQNPNGGDIEFRTADTQRSPSSVATINLGADDDNTSGQVWRRSRDTSPTRIKATCQFGTVEIIDTAAEAAGKPRSDGTVDTIAASLDGAADVANLIRNQDTALRLVRFTVDLASATQDLYAALLENLAPGVRLRVAGLPTGLFGYSYLDVYVQGWSEENTPAGYVVTFDCSPSDTEALFDTARFGWGDGVATLSSSLTSSGTSVVIITAPGANRLTTDDASLTSGIGTWVSSLNATPAPNFVTFRTAAFGLDVGSVAAGAMAAKTSPYPAAEGAGYTFTGWARAATVARSCRLDLSWLNAAGGVISTTTGTAAADTTAGWTQLTVNGTAPAGTVRVVVVANVLTTGGAGEIHIFDDFSLVESMCLSTSAGDYPLDLDINGERVTVASAPASAFSPQTVTVTRGVAPTVARAHTAGEPVEVWDCWRFAF